VVEDVVGLSDLAAMVKGLAKLAVLDKPALRIAPDHPIFFIETLASGGVGAGVAARRPWQPV